MKHVAVTPALLRNGLNRFELRRARAEGECVLSDLYISVTHGSR